MGAQKSPTMSLGKMIARYRKLRNLRQSDLAEKVGCYQSYVARWENDQMRPSQKYLEQLAEALEVTVPQLLEAELGHVNASLDDEELIALLQEVPRLTDRQKTMLKMFLQDMVKLRRFQEVMQS